MYILAIDTSCDDTSAAVTQNRVVLSNIVSSQDEIHSQWGGVVPMLAKRAHQQRIDEIVALACKRAHKTLKDIDVFAVTKGPGLAIALEVGIAKAKELATTYKKPLVAVNHMEGHLFANFVVSKTGKTQKEIYPFIALLVSGSHSELLYVKGFGEYELIGQTLDDAAGEAFDKVARMLGLGYPGGSLLAKMAEKGNPKAYAFPLPMRGRKDLNFSFSGIKTAAFRLITSMIEQHPLTQNEIQDLAASFQSIAIEHLVKNTLICVKQCTPKQVVLGGGVSANILLRKELRKKLRPLGIPLLYPTQKKLCADNAAMIAVAAYEYAKRDIFIEDLALLDRNPILSLTEENV